MSAYQLTERERDVTSQILRGSSTTQIAADLYISPHTVQQHLKSVFDKTGVRSRRDLVGKIFFHHYEPRLRDNEHRVLQDNRYAAVPRGSSVRRAETLPPPSEDAAVLRRLHLAGGHPRLRPTPRGIGCICTDFAAVLLRRFAENPEGTCPTPM